jgi:hypothetical protein
VWGEGQFVDKDGCWRRGKKRKGKEGRETKWKEKEKGNGN